MESNIVNKRTAGQWHIEENERGKMTRIYCHPNKFICDARGRQGSFDGDESSNEANAAFICKAVNNYDSLLAENETLKQNINCSLEIAKSARFIFSNESDYPDGTMGRRIFRAADEAIELNKNGDYLLKLRENL